MADDVVITLTELTRPEVADLKREVGAAVTTEGDALAADRLGSLDPSTVRVVLTVAAMAPLAMFIVKNRRGPVIHRAVKIHRKDGTVEERVLDIDFGSSTSDPKAITATHPAVTKVIEFLQSLLSKSAG